MKYLISAIDNTTHVTPPDVLADEIAAVDAFNDRLASDGYFVFADGLAAPSSATVIDNRGEEPVFSDGPFLESKEFMGGLWIIEAPDLDVALKLTAEASKVCNRKLELRPFRA